MVDNPKPAPLDLAAVKALCDAAPRCPWSCELLPGNSMSDPAKPYYHSVDGVAFDVFAPRIVAFLARITTLIPQAAAEIEALRAEVERLRRKLGEIDRLAMGAQADPLSNAMPALRAIREEVSND